MGAFFSSGETKDSTRWTSGWSAAAACRRRLAAGCRSALTALSTSEAPDPVGKARVNASTSPSGFLRSRTLLSSKNDRKQKPSGSLSATRAAFATPTGSTGSRTVDTGIGERARTAAACSLAVQTSSRDGDGVVADDVDREGPVARSRPVRERVPEAGLRQGHADRGDRDPAGVERTDELARRLSDPDLRLEIAGHVHPPRADPRMLATHQAILGRGWWPARSAPARRPWNRVQGRC